MSEKIVVPALGESVTEATVSKWLKTVGEKVDSDEPVVELETDKVNVEVPSPSDGVLENISVKEGDTVEVGALLGSIGAKKVQKIDKEEKKYTPPPKKEEVVPKIFDKPAEKKHKKVEQKLILKETPEEPPLILSKEITSDKQVDEQTLSPSARKIASEKKIDLSKIAGSGKNGVILKEDLLNLMGSKPAPNKRKITHGPEEKIKMTRLRMTIAKRLKEAQNNAAMLTTFNEVDMTNIIEMRKDNQDDFQNRFGIKLGMMSFFVKASIVALKNFPAVNAEIEGDEIIYKNYYNISFAVGTDKGLVVPVLKDADVMSFADIEKNIKEISDKAKSGKLTIEDLQGGTFTISNGGVYGSMLSTPILNLPQSGVLGMHNIVERPVVIEGEIMVRPIMYLALSYDHRIIDGAEAARFNNDLKENLGRNFAYKLAI